MVTVTRTRPERIVPQDDAVYISRSGGQEHALGGQVGVESLRAVDAPYAAGLAGRSFEEADYLAHEVPGVTIAPDTVRAMEQAGRGAARAVGIELAADLLAEARKLVSGVILTAAEEDLNVLAPLRAVVA